MRKISVIGSVLAAVLLSSPGWTQTQAPAPANPPAVTKADAAPKLMSPHWRSSKLIGVKVYNEQNERLGDVNEIILDGIGKVTGYVIGVGGFLGMGEHDILVEPGNIKFMNEPVRTSSAPAPAADGRPAPRTGSDTMTTRPVAARTGDDQWYPDHGVMSATKDQLKAMPQFKYSNYN